MFYIFTFLCFYVFTLKFFIVIMFLLINVITFLCKYAIIVGKPKLIVTLFHKNVFMF